MKRFLPSFLLCVFLAACQTQGVQGGGIVPGSAVMGAAGEARSASGEKTDSGDGTATIDERSAGDLSPSGKFSDVPSSTSSSSMMYYSDATPMPAGTVMPTHDPEGTWRYALKGTSEISCAVKGSNQVMLEIRGSVQYAMPHYERLPSGEYRLTNELQRLPSDGGLKVEVLRVVFKNNDQLLFLDQVPASATPNGMSIQGVDLALVDLEVSTTDPDSVYFLVVSKDSSPLFRDKPHAGGICGASDCQPHLGRYSNDVLTQWLASLPSPDPLPECPLAPRAMVISPAP